MRRCIWVGLPNSWSHFTAITSLCNINWMSRIMNWTKFVSLTSPHLPSQSSLASHVTCWLENGNKIFPQFSIIGIFIPANFSFRDSNVTLPQPAAPPSSPGFHYFYDFINILCYDLMYYKEQRSFYFHENFLGFCIFPEAINQLEKKSFKNNNYR